MGFRVVYNIDKVWFRGFGEMVGEMLDKLEAACERGGIVPLRLIFSAIRTTTGSTSNTGSGCST